LILVDLYGAAIVRYPVPNTVQVEPLGGKRYSFLEGSVNQVDDDELVTPGVEADQLLSGEIDGGRRYVVDVGE